MRARRAMIGGALLVIAGAALLAVPGSIYERRRNVMDVAARVIAYVARGESNGKFAAQNRNTDGQGLSYGILQWSQRGGGLGKLLEAMYAADPVAFTNAFGADAGLLRRAASSPSEATRMSLPLWQEPWTTRFTTAGQVEALQQAQLQLAATGASWQAAMAIADQLQVYTERALVLFFDRANHHGSSGARKLATAYVQDLTRAGDTTVHYDELLAGYAARCAAPYWRSSAPTELVTDSGKTWRQVGMEWHLFAGKADLYEIIIHRTREILHDPALADDELERSTA